MRRLWPIIVVLAASGSCVGRSHIQDDGDYELAFVESKVIKDTCGTLAGHPVADAPYKKLWNAKLVVLGDTVRLTSQLFSVQLVGDYQQALGSDKREHFILDGSANNVTANIAGAQCLVDIVNMHLEANTESAELFTGVVSVRYDTRQPASCNCEYLVNFRAVKQTP